MKSKSRSPDLRSSDELMEHLKAEIARPPFHRLLNPIAHSVNVQTGEVTVRLPYKSDFSYSPDEKYIHGGVISALIDLTAYAAMAIQTNKVVRTVDLRIDYLSPAHGAELLACGIVTKLGRSIGRADVTVTAGDEIVAIGRGTFMTF